MTAKFTAPSLLALMAISVSACAPATTPTTLPVGSAIVEPSATPFQPVVSTETPVTLDPAVSATHTLAPLPAATSRGPDLHATDPTTVSLASGQYQFVEFFRFT